MRDDLDLLQGTWAVTELEMEGQTISGGMLANARVEITGNRFSSLGMGTVYEGTVTLDDSAIPHQLNMKFDAGPERATPISAFTNLREIREDLSLDTGRSPADRVFPRQPAAGSSLKCSLAVKRFHRRKTKHHRPGPPSQEQGKAASPATEFEGEWQMVSAVMDGVPMDPSAVEWVKRITHGSETSVYAGPQLLMKMEFSCDASKAPKTIDYVNTAGSNKGKSQQGIYVFEGGILTICVAAPGKTSSHTIQSDRGDGRTFTVWKRADITVVFRLSSSRSALATHVVNG
jgi:uncharacterized protein (TIGR03067 family)